MVLVQSALLLPLDRHKCQEGWGVFIYICVCRQSQTQTAPKTRAYGNGVGDIRQRNKSANCQSFITLLCKKSGQHQREREVTHTHVLRCPAVKAFNKCAHTHTHFVLLSLTQ